MTSYWFFLSTLLIGCSAALISLLDASLFLFWFPAGEGVCVCLSSKATPVLGPNQTPILWMQSIHILSQVKRPGHEIDSSPHPIIIYLLILLFVRLMSIPHPMKSLNTSGAICTCALFLQGAHRDKFVLILCRRIDICSLHRTCNIFENSLWDT